MRMLVAASIMYELARACREKLIPDCRCGSSEIPFIDRTKDKLVIGGCDADMNWAAAITRLIMVDDSNDCFAQHNTEVGIKVSVEEGCSGCSIGKGGARKGECVQRSGWFLSVS